MQIQFNSDKTIMSNERQYEFFSAQITEELKTYDSSISRIEVHLSDENGKKEGINTIRCLLETRIEGKQPTVVSCQSNTIEASISCALKKLKAQLKTIIEKSNNFHK